MTAIDLDAGGKVTQSKYWGLSANLETEVKADATKDTVDAKVFTSIVSTGGGLSGLTYVSDVKLKFGNTGLQKDQVFGNNTTPGDTTKFLLAKDSETSSLAAMHVLVTTTYKLKIELDLDINYSLSANLQKTLR